MSRPDETYQRAVALRYDGVSAPRVTAKGEDELARAMLAKADEYGVPIHRDAGLLNLLSKVELDQEIPIQLFVAVAEVLAFAYALKGEAPPLKRSRTPGDVIEQRSDDIVLSAEDENQA